jgi:glycine dehydrogenase subunit 1
LLVTAATIHMALLGSRGLERVAAASHANTVALSDKLAALDGVHKVFARPGFHEAVFRFDLPIEDILRALSAQSIVGGVMLMDDYPELGNCLLVCATETKTVADLETYVSSLQRISERLQAKASPVQPKMM